MLRTTVNGQVAVRYRLQQCNLGGLHVWMRLQANSIKICHLRTEMKDGLCEDSVCFLIMTGKGGEGLVF